MRHSVLLLTLSLIGLAATARGGEPVTLASLLAEMVDRDQAARLPAHPFHCLQASSYDRAQTDPNNPKTWFANHDYEQFIRTETNEGRKEWVIMEHTGPGAIVRFWAPVHQPTDKQVIRFYFDGAKTPAIAVNYNDLLRGRLFVKPPLAFVASDEKTVEGVAGDLYLPIPFASGCKITLDGLPFYYNINYRAYDKDTEVKTFTMADYEAAAPRLKETADALKNETLVWGYNLESEPSGKTVLDFSASASGSAIRELKVQIDPQDAPQVLRSAIITASFDGEPTIWCPLGEFFGCGARLSPVEDWYRSVSADGTLTARWPMPYKKSAHFEITDSGKKKAEIKLTALPGDWHWDDRSMHFHATWRHQYPIETKAADGTMDWNYLEASGQGIYMGDTLTVFSPVAAWYGEGDERVYVDGEKFPSHLGTGTEDYYGYAWGMAHQFSSPFLSMPRRDSTGRGDWRGYTTTSRLRLLDGVPFQQALKFDMEIWDWAATKLDYAAGTFWYARPGATCNRAAAPEEAARELIEWPPCKFRGAIECEKMKILSATTGLAVEEQQSPLEWSGGAQRWVRATKPGDAIEMLVAEGIKSPRRVTLYATKSYDYGILRLSVNGQPVAKPLDGYSEKSVVTGPIDLGVFEPRDGRFVLRAEVIGSNPKSRGSRYYFGLDCVVLSVP